MSKVAVLKTKPSTVLQDYEKLMNLADFKKALPKNKELVIKLNLSWSLYYPACSTEPWQLDGVLKTLTENGYKNIYPVENRTVVTNVWKGAQGNKWLPILKKYGLKYYPLTETKWVKYRPINELLALDEIFHHGTWVPEMFIGKNVLHLPTMKCVHPDTKISISKDETVKIKDLVSKIHKKQGTITNESDKFSMSKKSLHTLNIHGKVEKGNAKMFWETPATENIIEVKTETHKKVKVSKQHPFLTPNGWVQSKYLKPGDKIAVHNQNKKEYVNAVPLNPKLFLKLKQIINSEYGVANRSSFKYAMDNGYVLVSKEIVNRMINELKRKRISGNHVLARYLKFLTSEDIHWDSIESVEEMGADTPSLYDLTVEKTSNFIGNGIILHNTHGHTTITGAMKNAFGGLITMKRHHCHKNIHEVLVDLLTIQKEIHPKLFAVMDGTVAGDGAGPRTMDVKVKNCILASEDQVAIDAISAKMMGFDPMKIDFIRIAHDKGLGIGDPKQIDVVGEDIKNVNFGFKTKKSLVIFMDQTLRKKYPIIEPILFHTPLFKMCIFGSEYYHDHYWYPRIGKKKIDQFMKTEWGQLFRRY